MKKINKILTLSVIAALSIVISLCANMFMVETNKTYAQSNVEIDLLGNLSFESIDNAIGYQWKYTIGEETSINYASMDNSINVRAALKKAAEQAKQNSLSQASVKFTITPVLNEGFGTSFEYTHEFVQYINFDYTTHDISEVNSNIISGRNTTMNSSSNRNTENGFWKNDILTFGLHYDGTATPIWMISVGGETSKLHSTNSNYSLTIYANGSSGWRVNLKGSDLYMTGSGNGAMAKEEDQYMSLAVFDTYGIAGNIIGETIYLSSATKNTNGDLVVNNEKTLFCDSNTITEAMQAGYHSGWEEEGDGKVVVGFNEYNDTQKAYLFPSVESSNVTAVDFLGNLSWARIDGAISYKWTYTVNGITSETKTSNANSAFVGEALTVATLDAKNNSRVAAKVSFSIIPVYSFGDGEEILFNHSFTDHIDYSYSSHDISEAHGQFAERTNMSSASNRALDNAFSKNDVLEFGLYTSLDNGCTPLYEIGLGGDSFSVSKVNYYIRLYSNGTSGWRAYVGEDDKADQVLHKTMSGSGDAKIDVNTDHYFKIAVFDVYDISGNIIGETLYVSDSLYDYATDTLKVNTERTVFYSSSEIESSTSAGTYHGWDESGDGKVKFYFGTYYKATDTLNGVSVNAYENTEIFSIDTKPLLAQKVYTVYVMSGDDVLATKEYKYGKPYDFSECTVSAQKAGYDLDGWSLNYDGKEVAISDKGTWIYDSNNNVALVEANFTPITYSITYSGISSATNDNETEYTIESQWQLLPLKNLPQGKIFDGWYLASDTQFSQAITSLKGRTGDIELVANIIDGYIINVDGEDKIYKVSDGSFTLIAPDVIGKVFSKWQVYTSNGYVDYTGSNTITPTSDMTFRSVYECIEYSLTFIAEGATHTNPSTYTIDSVVTLKAAEKEGYFFLGWYKESDFKTKLEHTDGLTENITLYAKFVQDLLPKKLELATSENLQKLPVPQLPEGSSYIVELYSGENKLELTDSGYFFKTAGDYVIKYVITLPTGVVATRQVDLRVDDYYTVNIYYGDSELITIRKKAGEKLLESDLPQPPDGMKLKGVYTEYTFDNKYDMDQEITEDLSVYVKWTKNGGFKPWVIVTISVGAVLIIGTAIGVIIYKKKNKK